MEVIATPACSLLVRAGNRASISESTDSLRADPDKGGAYSIGLNDFAFAAHEALAD